MNDKQKEAYDTLAKKMDLDYEYKVKLKDFHIAHGFIPDASVPDFPSIEHHRQSFEAFKKDRFKCWRTMPKVVKRIKRAAKGAVKAKGLEELTAEAHCETDHSKLGVKIGNIDKNPIPVVIDEPEIDETQKND